MKVRRLGSSAAIAAITVVGLFATSTAASAEHGRYMGRSWALSGNYCPDYSGHEGFADFDTYTDDWHLWDTCSDGDWVWVAYRVDEGIDGMASQWYWKHSSGSGQTVIDKNYEEPFALLYQACPSDHFSDLCGEAIYHENL